MKTCKQQKMLCVSAAGATEFQEKMNLALAGLREPQITFPQLPFTAYIVYEESWSEPESVREEYSLRGERYICVECPYFKKETDENGREDRRRKWHFCRYFEKPTKASTPACESFYEKLAVGEFTPKRF